MDTDMSGYMVSMLLRHVSDHVVCEAMNTDMSVFMGGLCPK